MAACASSCKRLIASTNASGAPSTRISSSCLGVTYEWSDCRNGLFWWIQSVYVDADQRARVVFSALHAEVKRQAQQESNVCGIRFYVERDNETAMRTYQGLGMIETAYRLMEEEF